MFFSAPNPQVTFEPGHSRDAGRGWQSQGALEKLSTRGVRRTDWATIIALMTVAAFTTTSCNVSPAQPTRLAAALFGKLVFANNCLRVDSANLGASYLLIWPPYIDVRMDNATVDVSDKLKSKITVWRIGETVEMAGGIVNRINDGERPLFSNDCPGPYWLVGDVVLPPPVTRAIK